MKIAYVVSTYPPYYGGMGNVAHAWVEGLRAKGHEVVVFAPGVGMRPWLRWGNAALCPQLLWRLRGFDVVHLHWPFLGGAEFVLAYFFIQKIHPYILQFVRMCSQRDTIPQKFIVTYHMDLVGRGVYAAFFHAYQRIMVPWMLRVADTITVSSLDYANHSRWIARSKKLVEIPFGVDDERFASNVKGSTLTAQRSNLNRDDRDAPTALFVGALDRAHYFKGVDVLLTAWRYVIRAIPDARLLIVGDGDGRERFEKLAQSFGIAANVTFFPKPTLEELSHLYQQANVFVFPSIDASEAFGLVVLEAMASGLPVIASDLPGVRTLVEEGKTGYLVPPRDAEKLAQIIIALLRDPQRQKEFGAEAHARVLARYQWEYSVDALRWVYEYPRRVFEKLACIVLQDRKVIVVRSRGKDAWYIPGGKRIANEGDIDALAREIHEELGVALHPESVSFHGAFEAQAHGKPPGITVRMLCYLATLNGEPQANGEIEEVAYFTFVDKPRTTPVSFLIFDDLKKRRFID